ncbi:MAG TPA: GMC oxidoreductase [Verrucomicrobiae bacterium]|nr:GMC oxidoreductase [Verrucomicrobiae bacterium]
MQTFDYIVVGSGCSGAIAAQTLVDAGKQVAMLDVGETNPVYQSLIPDEDFLTLRKTDPEQYKYFIGEHAQGVVLTDSAKGAQVTPSRSHMLRNVDTYIPLQSKTFTPIESLGYGGLGIAWGLQCWEFSRKELNLIGVDVERAIRAYETIAKRIGISGTRDSAAPYTLGELKSYQPSPDMDRNMQRIYTNYSARKAYFERIGFYLGRTPLALITERGKANRKRYAYRDMDFYDDNELSGWRPWITVDALQKRQNFTYIGGFLATRFSEKRTVTTIHGVDTATSKPVAYNCKRLVLATGALGSARIALRSFDNNAHKLPFLCNPYTYVPCIQPALFGKGPEPRKIGFGQLSAFLNDEAEHDDTSILTLYSYQSLMLFRIIHQAPFNFSDARPIMQYLSSGLVVTGIQHSDKHTPDKYLQLHKSVSSPTSDELHATYILSKDELAGQRSREDRYIKALRKTGLYAIKRMSPGHGSSVHYAGTLPFSTIEKLYHTDPSGKLYGTNAVYVADSSTFQFLPARGLTFTILANAQITAENVLKS